MRVGVYVDGYNLYYSGRRWFGRGMPGWRWLSPRALTATLVEQRRNWTRANVHRVVYCTARVDAADDPAAYIDQDVYLKALAGFGSEYPTVACLVGFDLVEGQFDLPAFVVCRGEVECWCELVVCDGGDETEQLLTTGPVFDDVLDDPDRRGLGRVEVATGGRGGDECLTASAA